jgi:hypothetical protein
MRLKIIQKTGNYIKDMIIFLHKINLNIISLNFKILIDNKYLIIIKKTVLFLKNNINLNLILVLKINLEMVKIIIKVKLRIKEKKLIKLE